jgi:peptide/nickel transport system substrate-binding protein
VWQELLREADFRRALSLAIERKTINQLVFHGLGIEAANSVLRESPLYHPDFATAWAVHAPEAANALLDGLGLERRAVDGRRLLPDGRPLDLTIATTAERPSRLEVLRFVVEAWSALGIEARIETMPRHELRQRALDGDITMSAWKGLENGVPGPNWPPSELVPSEAVQLGWPAWGLYVESGGYRGLPVDMPDVARLIFLRKAWETAESRADRAAAWQALLAWHAENVFSIGTVHAVPQPVVRRQALRNVPEDAIYNWEPGAYFGLYQPPAFWFDTAPRSPD